jgi:choline dehydrogenase-like flavoprotein
MPTIPRANTNLSTVAVAEQIADWLRAETWPENAETAVRGGFRHGSDGTRTRDLRRDRPAF